VARVLIVGCGCRGRSLARALLERGHAVRGTTREPQHRAEIELSGAEPYVGDPDRVGTLIGALDGASVACLLLGSAAGTPEALAALHGSRLQMLLARTIDTPVRGVVYEATGTVDAAVLRAGAQRVADACERFRIPYALLGVEAVAAEAWPGAAVGAIEAVLDAHRPGIGPDSLR
jgi:uncharacterized protein YbjT (DUF2867 family)